MEEWAALRVESDSKLWKLLLPKLKRGKENAEKDALRMVVDEKDGRARIASGQAIAYTHIIAEVENAGANIDAAENRMEVIREQIRTAKSHSGIID